MPEHSPELGGLSEWGQHPGHTLEGQGPGSWVASLPVGGLPADVLCQGLQGLWNWTVTATKPHSLCSCLFWGLLAAGHKAGIQRRGASFLAC